MVTRRYYNELSTFYEDKCTDATWMVSMNDSVRSFPSPAHGILWYDAATLVQNPQHHHPGVGSPALK